MGDQSDLHRFKKQGDRLVWSLLSHSHQLVGEKSPTTQKALCGKASQFSPPKYYIQYRQKKISSKQNKVA